MARTDNPQDLGLVLNLSGAALLTTYVAGADQAVGNARILSLFVIAVGKAATTVTSVEVKVQVKDILGNYYDAVTLLNDSTGGTATTVQTMTVTASTSLYYLIQTENLAPSVAGFRVTGKSTGAAGSGADSLKVYAVVM